MGKGWLGFALVCGLSGCADDASNWVLPGEDAAAGRPSVDAGMITATSARTFTTAAAEVSSVNDSGAGAAVDASRTQDSGPEGSDPDAGITSTTSNADAASVNTEEIDNAAASSTYLDATLPDASNSQQDAVTPVTSDQGSESEANVDDAGSDAGGSEDVGSEDGGSEDGGSEDGGTPEPLEARAGFIDIESVSYVRLGGNAIQTSTARMFYAFTPADELPEEAPVFVFFNGGPGSATSSGLLSYGTGPYSLPSDLSGPDLAPNPWSWTQMGSLLYFDTRQAGFSYSTLDDPSDASARELEWVERNFNSYVDASDSVRLVLRVLSQLPGLRDNPIILVGESYGGTRATMMLWYLLDPERLRQPSFYQDETLADEITSFFGANAQDSGDSAANQAKRQLPAQVLIQPFFAANQFSEQDDMRCLSDSPAQQVAAELGTDCELIELERDAYKINEPPTWSITLDTLAQQTLLHPLKLPVLLGVELEAISGLSAATRTGAYRALESGFYAAPSAEFVGQLGQLEAWDAYHLTLTPRSPWPTNTYTDRAPCQVFPWVAQQVDTLITNAKWDNVVLTTVLPTTLFNCSQGANSLVDSIRFAPESTLGLGDSGQMVFQFNGSAPEGESETEVEIRGYDAGHMVTVTHAEPLFRDVQEFLAGRGVL